jgi:hypothetical protein
MGRWIWGAVFIIDIGERGFGGWLSSFYLGCRCRYCASGALPQGCEKTQAPTYIGSREVEIFHRAAK